MGFPEDEAQRRKAWMELPRATRAAIRRMHHLIGHKSNSVLIHRLRGARVVKRLIDGMSKFKCDDCAQTSKEAPTHPTAAPSLYIFNYEVLLEEASHPLTDASELHNILESLGWLAIHCHKRS